MTDCLRLTAPSGGVSPNFRKNLLSLSDISSEPRAGEFPEPLERESVWEAGSSAASVKVKPPESFSFSGTVYPDSDSLGKVFCEE